MVLLLDTFQAEIYKNSPLWPVIIGEELCNTQISKRNYNSRNWAMMVLNEHVGVVKVSVPEQRSLEIFTEVVKLSPEIFLLSPLY